MFKQFKKIISMVLCLALIFGTFGIIGMQSVYAAFSDTRGHWAENIIDKWSAKGIINGDGDGTFRPDDSITRAEFTKIVVTAKGYTDISSEIYTDVSPGDWYYNVIMAASYAGIIKGDPDGSFRPNESITREEACVIISRAYTLSGGGNTNFIDEYNISDWAFSAISELYNNNIIIGYEDGSFMPLAPITRAETVQILDRIYKDDPMFNSSSDDDWYISSMISGNTGSGNSGNGYNSPVNPNVRPTAKPNTDDKDLSQDDSIYELNPEHIAMDDETCLHYTDNIILAFIKSGLSSSRKNEIAKSVSGKIVAQLSGGINLLQIEVSVSSLDELNNLSEQLMSLSDVNYASPDILINKDLISYSNTYSSNNEYAGESEWWFKAIEADYVWNNYEKYIEPTTVGVIDTLVDDNHTDLKNGSSKKVTFADKYYRQYNESYMTEELNSVNKNITNLNHGTGVTGILAADRNNIGITGVANKSNVIFASFGAWQDEWSDEIWGLKFESELGNIYALKKEIELGAKVINNSYGITFHTERYFNDHRNDEGVKDFNSYEAYKKSIESAAHISSIFTAVASCELIKSNPRILFVESAGNGEDNGEYKGPGIDAFHEGAWAGIERNETFEKICNRYNMTYDDLKDHILVVGAVEDSKEGENYYMTDFSNYGETVDICAPGKNLLTCSVTEESGFEGGVNGTSEAAPMVTGTAAILWGIDPTLSAAQVKDYIIKGAKCEAIGVANSSGYRYPMLNVRGAVEQLIHQCNITVLDKDNGQPIQDADISFNNKFFSTDENGKCEIYLPVGKNNIHLEKDGYKAIDETIEIEDMSYSGFENNFVTLKTIYMEKDNIENSEDKLLNAFIDKVVGKNSDYLYFLPDDYDNDGVLEAFGITGWGLGEDTHTNVNIWFIDSQCNCTLAKSDTYGRLMQPIAVSNGKFISWCETAGGSGSRDIVLGCKNGKLFEPKISGKYAGFGDRNMEYMFSDYYDFERLNCDYIGYYSYFKDGGGHMWDPIPFDYDSSNREFVERKNQLLDYDKILDGDFSDFAGVWKNERGDVVELYADGMDGEDSYGDFEYYVEDIRKNSDGAYTWAIAAYYKGTAVDGYRYILYPVGVDVIAHDGKVVNTDTSKVRLWGGNGTVSTDQFDYIYYKQ